MLHWLQKNCLRPNLGYRLKGKQALRQIVAQSTTVSLVLGSGGARGLAHIGVIQWLTENGYNIRSIAGSSMGALVGGIYATSKLEVYAEWVLALERIQVVRLLDPTFSRAGLFKGERIMGVLRELIGDFAIEDLPVSFTAVATDLESGEEVWLREGKLFDAIRASIATPLIFTPFECSGRKLLDGGLVNPVPIAPTLNDTTEFTIAVNLGGPVELRPSPPPSAPIPDGNAYRQRIRAFIESLHLSGAPAPPAHGMLNIALASMEAMQNTIARLKLAAYSPDVTVEIPRNACGFHEFWRAEELIALGRERTAQAFAATGH
ncbi:MAG: patatin-like phospholipase family protein [Betaproteobacteria bacterium]|nr:patatin-like phospholipase family protein [Betaproteobacteria bacterium]